MANIYGLGNRCCPKFEPGQGMGRAIHQHFHHMVIHCSPPWRCACDKDFECLDQFRQHLADSHGGAYFCHHCPRKFRNKGTLMVHLRVFHRQRNATEVHARLQENKGNSINEAASSAIQPNYPSPEATTSNSENLGSMDGNPVCSLCNAIWVGDEAHPCSSQGAKVVWPCSTCKKKFTSRNFLRNHLRLHTGETPYRCEICSRGFTFQQSYHKHRLYHSEERPHRCDQCPKAFREISTLHNHKRIHTGEKPYSCEDCGKRFRQRVGYIVHRRIHTNERPYQCTACGRHFRYKVTLHSHKCLAVSKGNSESSHRVMEPHPITFGMLEFPEQSTVDRIVFEQASRLLALELAPDSLRSFS